MAYAQWVAITLKPLLFDLSVKHAHLDWGKFYKGTNKDDEISAADVDKTTVSSKQSGLISSCGRSDASSGTEGKFDIYDGDQIVGTYSWDCPWGSKTNTSTWTPQSDDYTTEVTGANLDSGALGNVTIKIVKA